MANGCNTPQKKDYLITDFQVAPDNVAYWPGSEKEIQSPTAFHGFKTQRQVRNGSPLRSIVLLKEIMNKKLNFGAWPLFDASRLAT